MSKTIQNFFSEVFSRQNIILKITNNSFKGRARTEILHSAWLYCVRVFCCLWQHNLSKVYDWSWQEFDAVSDKAIRTYSKPNYQNALSLAYFKLPRNAQFWQCFSNSKNDRKNFLFDWQSRMFCLKSLRSFFAFSQKWICKARKRLPIPHFEQGFAQQMTSQKHRSTYLKFPLKNS